MGLEMEKWHCDFKQWVLWFWVILVVGGSFQSKRLTAQYSLEFASVTGKMLAHSVYNKNLNQRRSMGIQATALWLLPPDTGGHFLRYNKHRFVGVSLLHMDMGDGLLNGDAAHRSTLTPMGTGIAAMAISGARISMPPLLGFNAVQMQWGFGLLRLSQFYDSVLNPTNLAMSSTMNFAAQLKFQAIRHVTKHGTIALGCEMMHTSNSNWQKPNVGLNYFQVSFGWVHRFHSGKHMEADRCYWKGEALKQLSMPYQVSFRQAFRKYRRDFPVYYSALVLEGSWGLPNAYSNKKIPITRKDGAVLGYHSLQGMPKGEWRFGINVFYETKAKKVLATGEELALEDRLEMGAFARRVMRFGPLDVFLDFGLYAVGPQKDRIRDLEKARWFYNAIGTQYRINQHWMLIHRLKAHYHVADYMELGLLYQW